MYNMIVKFFHTNDLFILQYFLILSKETKEYI